MPGLSGKKIVLTRPDDGHGENFAATLSAAGADVTLLPLIETHALPFRLPQSAFDWLFFTSRNGIQAFAGEAGALLELPCAVVGPATGQALENLGVRPAFVSPRSDAESAARAFADTRGCQGLRILWPCGSLASPALSEILGQAGAIVTPLVVYETRPRTDLSPDESHRLKTADMLVFTSASAVESYQRLDGITTPYVACLGPKTAQAAREQLGRMDLQAEPATLEALAEAIQRFYERGDTA